MSQSHRVKGYCPFGCGETLFLGNGGHITCALIGCPDPGAVDQILSNRETEHIVVFNEKNWSCQHPLRERLHGDLFGCELVAYLSERGGPPVKTGRYRVRGAGDKWECEEL